MSGLFNRLRGRGSTPSSRKWGLMDRVWWIGLAVLFVVGGYVRQVDAHAGGTPRIVNEPAGDFVVSVWSLPDPVVSGGESNFIVFVADGTDFDQSRTATPVLGADIQIVFSQDGREVTFPATHERATNKLFYESYLVVPEAGTWQVDLFVTHEGKMGTAQFEVEIIEPETETSWLLYGGIGLVMVAVGWFVWQSRQDEEDE